MNTLETFKKEIIRTLPLSEKQKRQLNGLHVQWWALGLAGLSAVTLVILYLLIEDHDWLFLMAEGTHFTGIGILIYKLVNKKSCAGLSLRTQIITATFLAVRLLCSVFMEYDWHTMLDLLTLIATSWVIVTMTVQLKNSYQREKDTVAEWLILVPCLVLAILIHPGTSHKRPFRIMWAFCVYVEAVSVYPQLRMMQNTQVVERFTGNFVFALGVSRFLSCAHWVFQLINKDSYLMNALGTGMWPIMVLISEIVQTGILLDFCYYYIQAFARGESVIRLPQGVV